MVNFYHLVSAIIHQSTSWPATFATTYIVIGMLGDGAVAEAVGPTRQAMLHFLAEVQESQGQFSEPDWQKMREMADQSSDPQGQIVDWTEMVDNDELMNARYARAMLTVRALTPAIRACIDA